ncbi:MAG: hypothetical protein ACRYGM_04600 [Janthinobacterium lividum]
MAGMPCHRLDGRQQRRQAEPLDKPPHRTHPVILRNQLVPAEWAPFNRAALGTAQPRQPAAHPLRRRLLGQSLNTAGASPIPPPNLRQHPEATMLKARSANTQCKGETNYAVAFPKEEGEGKT